MSDAAYTEKESSLIQLNVTGLLFEGPVTIYSVALSNDTEVGKVIVHDGMNASAKERFRLSCGIGATAERQFVNGITFLQGVFIEVTGSHSSVDVELCPYERNKVIQ